MANEPDPAVTILDAAQAHYARGETFALLGRWTEALDAFDAAIAARPDYAEAWNRHGIALHELGEDDDALLSFAEAIRSRPDFPDPHSNRGISLRMLNRAEEAIAAADRALTLDPSYAAAYTTRGNALRTLGRIEEALATYDRALAATPGSAPVRFNRALCLLASGDFARGWPEYEWRWKMASHQLQPRVFDRPLWLGDAPVAGKTILLHAEQGLGDTIHFCRYAPLLAGLGARVVIGASPALHGVLTALPGVSLIVSRTETMPAFDLHCPMMSLPLAFKTTPETIPAIVPYLAAPDSHRQKWRDRLGPRRGMRLGLVWAGNPGHAGDRHRSLKLEMAAALVPDGVEVFCLQRDMRPDDIPALAMFPRIAFFGDDLADFSDTAALIAEMDLVVSVDTAVLHLAGAMGAPVWGLLPFASDWRWMIERPDTPWYPTMRLFRQQAEGGWEAVILAVRAAMERVVAGVR